MASKYTIPLKTVVKDMNLQPLHLSKDYETAVLTMADVNRPAMQLTGFYNYFDPKRMQVIGMVESTYLDTTSANPSRSVSRWRRSMTAMSSTPPQTRPIFRPE